MDCFSIETAQHRLSRGQWDLRVGWVTTQIGPDIRNVCGVLRS